ncbi:hypothetical protein GCM10022200_02910 [Microbacterium awajiense]|uniref:FAD-binding FR-type domain-containing protein n=1 Tax=Microbacterium awajiense TaxID=415214 RepID=A0ABP7A363_9MICO
MSSSTPTLVRPAYRPYLARVSAVRRLAPHFVRVSLTGPDLDVFGTAGLDQRVKLILPGPDGTISDFGQADPDVVDDGSWYERWRGLADDRRNPLRTYTVRRIDADARILDIDFVLHHDAGPAGAWAAAAAVGDQLVVVGPDERSEQSRIGLDWHPGTARRVLLAGDETAAPAIASILESLDDTWHADALIEVPTADDRLPVAVPPHVRVTWLARDAAAHGRALTEAVAGWTADHRDILSRAAAPRTQPLADLDVDRDLLWDSPDEGDGEFYAWIAGEAATVKGLRRHLVQECGVDRRRVAFMGYWRLGQSERQ